jgi:hypothetical protein
MKLDMNNATYLQPTLDAMSVFLIPKGVCKSMMDAISKFWWGDDAKSK